MSTMVRAQGLERRFRDLRALDGLDLAVPESSVYALVGPNGAGKTTTLKILMNLLAPSGGTAEILGTDSRQLGPRNLEEIGYVSEGQDMPLWMTAGYLFDYLEPFYPRWDRNRVRELVTRFDLPTGRKLDQLSRGMRMKASLISSLAYHPRLLILDEPFSGLDPMVREDLIEALAESAEETTILISSHDLGDIETFASHIAYIDHGRVRFSEEMTVLADRFREVEVTLGAEAENAPQSGGRGWPSHWVRPERSAAVVRFVDTRFDRERTREEIRRLFGDRTQVSVQPMPLRAIFVAMARSATRSV